MKFLSVILDQKISWKSHISHIWLKLAKCAAVLGKTHHFLDHGSSNLVSPQRMTIIQPRKKNSKKPSGTLEGGSRSANTVYSGAGDLLTQTGEIVGWKEELHDPINTLSTEEAETGDSKVGSAITQAGKTSVVDEIRSEYLKSLNVVGLSWLNCMCSIEQYLWTGRL